ncbi:MAG: radical SAM protein [Lentisphaerae bacterium]|nr:radical SAM protein [Lentisphaerota bacterium]
MEPFDVHKFDFTTEEALEAPKQNRLLSAEIEFNRSCNFRCLYCYAAGSAAELPHEAAVKAIHDVATLGARKIVILGGEPLLCRRLKEYILLAESLGMGSEIFTNASLVDEDWAQFFYEHNCRVAVKLNSLDPAVHDRLTGAPGSLEKTLRAIDILQKAGLDDQRLAASSVICSANEKEVVSLWKYLRSRHIKPYLEIMTPQGRLLEHRDLEVHPRRLKEIFDEIAAFDRSQGYEWDPQPPLVGATCLRHQYSCVIGATGDVYPCVGMTIKLGSVLEKPLAEIIFNSKILNQLKDFRNMIKGPCRTCEKADRCYGCRGAAYQLTGNYLASDPLCWRNCDELLFQPPHLPCDATQYLPHSPPIVMVTRLLDIGEWSTVEAKITPDNRFLRNNVFDVEALPEIAAQACAAVSGFEKGERHIKGLLTGLRNFEALAPVHGGDTLHVIVCETANIDQYFIVEFSIRRPADNVLCARGELSLCRI